VLWGFPVKTLALGFTLKKDPFPYSLVINKVAFNTDEILGFLIY
jgi:hypothetical protein